MKLTVQLVAWNGEKYISHLFKSLRNQTFKNWSLLVLDNGSIDKTKELIKKELKTLTVQTEFFELKENLGFAGGHNFLFSKSNSEYVLLLNQDMYLKKKCFEKLFNFMEKHSNFASASPLLLKWDFREVEKGDIKKSFTNFIDSAGLKVFKTRKIIDNFAGKNYEEVKNKLGNDKFKQVFGVSGALPIYKRSALREIAFENNVFDASFGSYKEDVDLAFRLASFGYNSAVVLNAKAYHDRTFGKEKSLKLAFKNKTKMSASVYNSYKNHFALLYKNEYWQNIVLDFLWIKCYEIKKAIFYLFFNPKVFFGALKEFKKNKPILKKEKEKIIKDRKISWYQMRNLWKL